MRSGPARHRFRVQESVNAPNGSGGFVVTWRDIGGVWAEVTLPSGRVEPVAERLDAKVTAELRARPRPSLIAGRRLSRSTVTYLIEAALPDNKSSMLRLLCSNVVNP
ncbi:head-tail adaptor protein [Pseudomonas sp. S2_H10]